MATKSKSAESSIKSIRAIFLNITCLVAFAIVLFLPILELINETVIYLLKSNANLLDIIIPGQRRLSLLLKSIELSFASTVSSTFMGVLVAVKLLEWKKGLLSIVRWAIPLLIIIPPYIHVNSWNFLFDNINHILQNYNISTIYMQGFGASWFIQTIAFLPITSGMALLGMEAINREIIDAGRLLRDDINVFTKVLLPLSSRIILAGAGLVFLLSIIDFTIPSLLQFNVYSLEIFAEFSSTNEPARAFLLSIPLLLISFVVFSGSQHSLKKIELSNIWNKSRFNMKMSWPIWFRIFINFAMILFITSMLIPFICMTLASESLQKAISGVVESADAIKFSIFISLFASLFSLPLSFIAAIGLGKKGKLAKIWWIIAAIPIAVPSSLIGIGIASVWNRDIFGGLYGSIFMPILASTVRFTTIGVMILWSYMSRLDNSLLESAKIFEKNSLYTWLRVKLPMIAPGIIAVFFLCFAFSMGEIGATLIVVPPGMSTVTIKIYNLMHYGGSSTVAGLSLFIIIITILSGLAAILILSRRKHND